MLMASRVISLINQHQCHMKRKKKILIPESTPWFKETVKALPEQRKLYIEALMQHAQKIAELNSKKLDN